MVIDPNNWIAFTNLQSKAFPEAKTGLSKWKAFFNGTHSSSNAVGQAGGDVAVKVAEIRNTF